MTGAETALILVRALIYASALFLWGASAYLSVLVPPPLRGVIAGRVAGLVRLSAILLWLMLLASLPLRAALLAEDSNAALSAPLLSALLWQTSVGLAWRVQMLVATLLCVLALASPRRPALIAPAAALFLATLTLTGHAAMQAGTVAGFVHQANDALHLLAAGAWTGALLPVVLILPRLRDPALRPAAQTALLNFSTMGHFAVALALLTGAVNAWLILGPSTVDVMSADAPTAADGLLALAASVRGSPYSRLLTAKVAVVAAMVALALVNRYALVPRLARRSRADRALAIGTLTEIALAALVLALVAAFGTMDPA